ncbi:MAG: FHA domain-containing protein [Minicystis sp.]
MGVLKHLASGREVVLASYFVVGRSSSTGVELHDLAASNMHASLLWLNDHWELRDQGSMNGTFVGEQVVRPPSSARIARGAILRFGCDEERWEMIDDSGPFAVARSLSTGQLRVAENGLLALPDQENVLYSILLDADGCWIAESPDGTRRPVKDGERLELAGQAWELLVPPIGLQPKGTKQAQEPPSIGTIRLILHVSRTAENVRAEVIEPTGKKLSLGERASFYLLSVLAEERLKEAQAGELPEVEQGWYDVPTLCTYLGTDERNLAVTVFRARALFAKAKIDGAEGIIERRFRQMRIGTGNVQVIKA